MHYAPTYLPACLPTYLPAYLPTYPPAYLPALEGGEGKIDRFSDLSKPGGVVWCGVVWCGPAVLMSLGSVTSSELFQGMTDQILLE